MQSTKEINDLGALIVVRMLQMMAAGVKEFQDGVLGLPVTPGPLPEHRHKFKLGHMVEELDEYGKAWHEGHMEAAVDALVDLIYVALGALLEMGVEPMAAFDPVQAANMAKVRGETKRGESYDAIKPKGWQPPDHAAVLAALTLRAQVPPAFLEATRILLERAAKYNSAQCSREEHFPLGMTSIFQMMWVKMARMKADITSNRTVNRDHLIDLMNYANFGVNFLDGRPL